VGKVLTVLLAAAAVLTAGCGGDSPPPQPEVTFAVDGTTARTGPFLYCDVMVTKCDRADGSMARLRVPPGTAVNISVPAEVAESPWSVAVQYRTAAGEQKEPETVATFIPNEQRDYTVRLPNPGDQLQTVEVKQASAKQEPGATSEIQLLARAVWSLQVDGL
jgi:hypothetical protein